MTAAHESGPARPLTPPPGPSAPLSPAPPFDTDPSMAAPAPVTMHMLRESPFNKGESGPVGESTERAGAPGEQIIWEGSTWDSCGPCPCFAPLCCRANKWRITDQVIDLKSGCCASNEDTLFIKRIRDLSFESSCLKRTCCCGRGTLVIHSSDRTHPELRLTTFGAKSIYRALQAVWVGGPQGQVDVDVMQ